MQLSSVCLLVASWSIVSVGFAQTETAVNATTGQSVAAVKVTKTLAAGESWVVSATTKLDGLNIGKGASITAPDGYSLTMTVNGIGTAIKAGSYKGQIVLTVTENIIVKYGKLDPHYFRTGIYVNDSAYVAQKSVAAIVSRGQVTGGGAKDIRIVSNEEKFNGVVVTGNSKYTIDNPVIQLTGNGGNDFAGYGAALMSSGTANVTVNNARITNRGCIRTAVFAGGNSTMRVNNSNIEVHNGTLPDDYTFTVETGKMMEVPWMLGLAGNNRATNLVANGTAYYTNTRIAADGWGCLSTDDTTSVRLYANQCELETIESGYGAYAIGDCIDTFSGCRIKVADMALIMANGSAAGVFNGGTVVNSGRFGVMVHGNNSGTLTIKENSVFNTNEAVIQVKSSAPTIVVDHAQLNAKNGVILEAIVNDDPNMPSGGGPGDAQEVNATFSNMALKGDIINSMTSLGNVNVTLANTSLTGAITTATAKAAGEIDQTHYSNIGKKIHTYAATSDAYGVTVSLNGYSTWTVAKTSYLNKLTLADGAILKAPEGLRLTMTVDGVATAIKAGYFAGKIVLTVSQ